MHFFPRLLCFETKTTRSGVCLQVAEVIGLHLEGFYVLVKNTDLDVN